MPPTRRSSAVAGDYEPFLRLETLYEARQYVLSIVLALLLDGVAAHSLFAQNEPVGDRNLSQIGAKELARSASALKDHLTLAAYFRDQRN